MDWQSVAEIWISLNSLSSTPPSRLISGPSLKSKRHADACQPHPDGAVLAGDSLDLDPAAVAIDSAADPFGRGAVSARIERLAVIPDLGGKREVVAKVLFRIIAVVARDQDGVVLAERDVAEEQHHFGDLLLRMLLQVLGGVSARVAGSGV